MINEFINIYEPSGIIQLSNGQVLIVEDDGTKPLSLLELNPNNPYDYMDVLNAFNLASIGVNDLEAIKLLNQDLGIMIVMDDGDEEMGQPGHYLFVPYENLKIDTTALKA